MKTFLAGVLSTLLAGFAAYSLHQDIERNMADYWKPGPLGPGKTGTLRIVGKNHDGYLIVWSAEGRQ